MSRKVAFVLTLCVIVASVIGFAITKNSGKLPVKKLDPWVLQSNNPNDEFGTYIGNGVVGARIGPEGIASRDGKSLPSFLAGMYEGESLVQLPDWSKFELDVKDQQFKLDINAPYRQTLHMKDGYVETELTMRDGMQRLTGKVKAFVLRNPISVSRPLPGELIVVRYELTPRWGGDIGIGNPGRKRMMINDDGIDVIPAEKPAGIVLAIGAMVNGKPWIHNDNSIKLDRGKPVVITRFVSIARSNDGSIDKAQEKAVETIKTAQALGYDKLFETNKSAWNDLWKSDIVIEGDPEAQQAVHACKFYLLCSAGITPWSIQPLGLSSNDYWKGHVFWDADTWMYPTLLAQHPELAKSIVDYRYSTLSGAMRNAKQHGIAGAEYAWESAATGLETISEPFCKERHIGSDVAIAQWQYYESTLDKKWLAERGWPVISACADYWSSRAKYNAAKDQFEILDVVPPDENAGPINNSAYTNASTKMTLEIAVQASTIVGKSPNPKWSAVANKMYIPLDSKTGRFIEHDGFNARETKQADVELLIYPLCFDMSNEARVKSFDFYKAKVQRNGPAMSSCVHAVISAQLGREKDAYKDFTESYKPFFRGPFLMFNEKRSDTWKNTCFLTGCGGMLQSVIYGFGGVRMGKAPEGFKEAVPGLYVRPCLPAKWKRLEIRRLKWRGKAYDLIVLPGNKWELKPASNLS